MSTSATPSPTPEGCYAVAGVLMVAVLLTMVGRVYVRRMKKVQMGLDDLFIFIAAALTIALGIVLIIGTARGTIGTHTLQNPITGKVEVTWHEPDIAKLGFISQVLAIVAYGAVKLSVLLLLRRIFVGKIFNIVSLSAIGFVTVWTVAFFFANLFECGGDPAYFWGSPKTLIKYCYSYKDIMLVHAATDVATDVLILTIPLPIIWKLHMTTGQKLGLMVVFLLGYMSTASAVLRIVFLVEDVILTTTGSRDVRGDYSFYMVWAFVEAGVGVVGASLPTLRPLLNARLPESLVNSVRSALSIGSNTQRPVKSDPAATDSDGGMELESRNVRSGHASGRGSPRAGPSSAAPASPIPADRILKQSHFGIDDGAAPGSAV